MSWVRLDDRFYNHRKIMSVSLPARWLYVSALCVANQHASNGVIDQAAQDCLLVAVGRSGSFDALAAELVKARLWEPSGSEFLIHDYLEYQLSDEEQRKERAASAERQKRFREKRRGMDVGVTPLRTELPTPLSTPSKTPPRPVPSRPDSSSPVPEEEAKASMLAGGPPPTPPAKTQIALLPDEPKPARKTRERKPRATAEEDAGKRAAGTAVWDAYAEAFRVRYGCDPQRNAKVNGQIAQFLARVPLADAPEIARWYVRHIGAFYAASMHSVGLMLRDAEKLAAEWRRGERVNAETARRNEQTEANPFGQELLRRQRERAQRGVVIKLVPNSDEDNEDDTDEN